MAVDVVWGQVEALVVDRLGVVEHLGIFGCHAEFVVGRSEVVIGVGVCRVGLFGLFEVLQGFGVAALLEHRHPFAVLAASAEVAPRQSAAAQQKSQ